MVSDAHAGLVDAIGATLPGASWQRCRTHYARNLLSQVPKSAQPWVATLLRTVFEQPDAKAVRQQMADQPGDGHIPRRVAQLAVLPGRADQSLLLPVPQHPRAHPYALGQARDRHQLVIPWPVRI